MTGKISWTTNTPTKPGMYWFRWLCAEQSHPEVVRVVRHPGNKCLYVVTGEWKATLTTEMPGDWWPEPLLVPKDIADG